MHEDIISRTVSKIGLAPVVINTDTTTNSIIIDTQGYDSGKIILSSGVVTAGDIIISAINESADSGMSGATAIPTERLYGNTLAGTAIDASATVVKIGFVAHYRYMRFVITSANSANLLVNANVELGHAEQAGY